jgi:hypothetical protein
MGQPAPRDEPVRQAEPRARDPFRRQPSSEMEYRRPLTEERITELGDGGPWKSDREFEDWLCGLAASREV